MSELPLIFDNRYCNHQTLLYPAYNVNYTLFPSRNLFDLRQLIVSPIYQSVLANIPPYIAPLRLEYSKRPIQSRLFQVEYERPELHNRPNRPCSQTVHFEYESPDQVEQSTQVQYDKPGQIEPVKCVQVQITRATQSGTQTVHVDKKKPSSLPILKSNPILSKSNHSKPNPILPKSNPIYSKSKTPKSSNLAATRKLDSERIKSSLGNTNSKTAIKSVSNQKTDPSASMTETNQCQQLKIQLVLPPLPDTSRKDSATQSKEAERVDSNTQTELESFPKISKQVQTRIQSESCSSQTLQSTLSAFTQTADEKDGYRTNEYAVDMSCLDLVYPCDRIEDKTALLESLNLRRRKYVREVQGTAL